MLEAKQWGEQIQLNSFSTAAINVSDRLGSRPGRFTPKEKTPITSE